MLGIESRTFCRYSKGCPKPSKTKILPDISEFQVGWYDINLNSKMHSKWRIPTLSYPTAGKGLPVHVQINLLSTAIEQLVMFTPQTHSTWMPYLPQKCHGMWVTSISCLIEVFKSSLIWNRSKEWRNVSDRCKFQCKFAHHYTAHFCNLNNRK